MANGFHKILLDCAREEGFPLAGALDLGLAAVAIAPHIERYDRWLGEGYSGAMSYLQRGRDRRADPRIVLPGTQSILCVALPYPKRPGGAPTSETGPRLARYIHGHDYHEEIAARLERVMQSVNERTKTTNALPLQWKVCVDTSAVLERSWAALAGLGWIGKNTLLIHPQYGSFLFLAEVLINQPTEQGPTPLPDYCGSCSRCLQSCPTKALKESHVLDSNRCTSYWTLEKRGELSLPEADKRAIGAWVAGCDICQEVCPFNFKPVKRELDEEFQISSAHIQDWQNWETLLREDVGAYKARIASSALNRVKPAQFSRNLAIAMCNAVLELSGDSTSRKHFQMSLRPLVQKRLDSETDESARTEWARCAAAFQSLL